MTYRRSYRFLLFILTLILCTSSLYAQTYTKDLANGITLIQQIISPDASASPKPEIINVLRIDPSTKGVSFRSMLSRDRIYTGAPKVGCETVSSMAKRLNAVAAINADFFGLGGDIPGDPLNFMVRDGELISEPSWRVVFGITSDKRVVFDKLTFDAKIKLADGKVFPVRGINRFRGDNEIVTYTPCFGEHTCTAANGSEAVIKLDGPVKVGVPVAGTVSEVKSGAGDSSITDSTLIISGRGTGARFIDENLKSGDKVTLEVTVTGEWTGKWDKIEQAVGGGNWLVRDGKEYINAEDAHFSGSFLGKNPRTMAGLAKDGKLLLVTVDGRQRISGGMSLVECARLMLSLGCTQAVNLDGGGSTTMATYYGILNSPSGGIQRSVANGIAVFGDEMVQNQDISFSIAPLDKPVQSGTTAQLMLIDTKTDQPLDKQIAVKAVWAADNGTGFVDQSGRFYGFKARQGTVIASIGGKTATMDIETVPGKPGELTAELKADPGGAPNRGLLNISAGDLNGNALRGSQVSVKVTGGTADAPVLTLDDKGTGSTGITWDGTPGAQVEVAAGPLVKTVKK